MAQQLAAQPTAAAASKASPALLAELGKSLKAEGPELASKVKGLVVFKIDDMTYTLDLRPGRDSYEVLEGDPKGEDKADLTLTVSDANFAQLVMGKLNPQQAFLMRKLKIQGSMGMAMKLQPILDAAAPKSKM